MHTGRFRRTILSFALAASCLAVISNQVAAQSAKIEWQVANRFRLFADQSYFDAHMKAYEAAGRKSVFETEQKLMADNRGRGWARDINRLCADSWTGRVTTACVRDGQRENYINPESLRIKLSVVLPPDFSDASCTWQIGPHTPVVHKCSEPLLDQRVAPGMPTKVSVIARNPASATLTAGVSVRARDVLIIGMGDSIASGEGNPTDPVVLSANGFCFRRPFFFGLERNREFFLPGRDGARVDQDCPNPGDELNQRDAWDAVAAKWMYTPCHRSLYSYQARTALALAIENPELSVTFVPLGCTGATIGSGMLGEQLARERPKDRKLGQAPKMVPSQVNQLRSLLEMGKGNPIRRPDLILLTVGANDIGFAGMVADIVIRQNPERSVAKRQIVDSNGARARMKQLGPSFRALRAELRKITGDNLTRVVFSTYPNPAIHDGGKACPATRLGFDAHPAYAIDGARTETTVRFVEREFLPTLRALVTCGNGAACADPDRDRMTYADQFHAAFANHGFCAASSQDPEFDRDCFRNGNSFNGNARAGLQDPLACSRPAGEFRAYARRARWFRTVNDSYFTAMTYPAQQSAFTNPSDIHDALWGVLALFYGGAMHPTAEGHAAMADGTLPAARKVLGLAPR